METNISQQFFLLLLFEVTVEMKDFYKSKHSLKTRRNDSFKNRMGKEEEDKAKNRDIIPVFIASLSQIKVQ